VTVRQTWFVDIRIPAVTALPSPRTRPAGSTTQTASGPLDEADLDRLRRGGAVLPEFLPGGMMLVGARDVAVDGGHATQLSYSDGLFSLSLFAQPGELDPTSLDGFTARRLAGTEVHIHSGLFREITWAGGGTVWTIVTDAPDATAVAVVGSLPADPPPAGVLARMSRGANRVGSWVDPFR
jgi:hypothetical protein